MKPAIKHLLMAAAGLWLLAAATKRPKGSMSELIAEDGDYLSDDLGRSLLVDDSGELWDREMNNVGNLAGLGLDDGDDDQVDEGLGFGFSSVKKHFKKVAKFHKKPFEAVHKFHMKGFKKVGQIGKKAWKGVKPLVKKYGLTAAALTATAFTGGAAAPLLLATTAASAGADAYMKHKQKKLGKKLKKKGKKIDAANDEADRLEAEAMYADAPPIPGPGSNGGDSFDQDYGDPVAPAPAVASGGFAPIAPAAAVAPDREEWGEESYGHESEEAEADDQVDDQVDDEGGAELEPDGASDEGEGEGEYDDGTGY